MIINPNHRDVRPIHIAAALGLAPLYNFLLDSQVRTDLRSRMGTPLDCAVWGPSLILTPDILPRHPPNLQFAYDRIGWSAADAAQSSRAR